MLWWKGGPNETLNRWNIVINWRKLNRKKVSTINYDVKWRLVIFWHLCSWFLFLVCSEKTRIHFNQRLATKARACKGVSQKRSSGLTFHVPRSVGECEGMNLHSPKWAPIIETPESSESDCKGQNPLNWRVPYIIENLLECRCQKWVRMTHLGN